MPERWRGACVVCHADGREGGPSHVAEFEPVFCRAPTCAAATCRACVATRARKDESGRDVHDCAECGLINLIHFSDAHPFRWLVRRRPKKPEPPKPARRHSDVMRERSAAAQARAPPPHPHPYEDPAAMQWELRAAAPGPRLAPTLPRNALFSETAPIDADEPYRDPPPHHTALGREETASTSGISQPPMDFRPTPPPLYLKPELLEAMDRPEQPQDLASVDRSHGRARSSARLGRKAAVPRAAEASAWLAEQRSLCATLKAERAAAQQPAEPEPEPEPESQQEEEQPSEEAAAEASSPSPKVIVAWRQLPAAPAPPLVTVRQTRQASPPVSPVVKSLHERLADPGSTLGSFARCESTMPPPQQGKPKPQDQPREAVVYGEDVSSAAYMYTTPRQASTTAEGKGEDGVRLRQFGGPEDWGLSTALAAELRRQARAAATAAARGTKIA